MKQARSAATLLILMTLLTGLAYPLTMTGLAQVLFPAQAHGTLITYQNATIGSKLIGQKFTGPEYFHSRPSAAGQSGYDPTSSGGSNLGPTSKKLLDSLAENVKSAQADDESMPVPSDLVTASASGLDPDISPAAAYFQAERIARTRGLSVTSVRSLIGSRIQGRQLGLFGEPRVNVLELNLALDELKGDK